MFDLQDIKDTLTKHYDRPRRISPSLIVWYFNTSRDRYVAEYDLLEQRVFCNPAVLQHFDNVQLPTSMS